MEGVVPVQVLRVHGPLRQLPQLLHKLDEGGAQPAAADQRHLRRAGLGLGLGGGSVGWQLMRVGAGGGEGEGGSESAHTAH